jgi:hypothetical protein
MRRFFDSKIRNVKAENVQVDEIRRFVKTKPKTRRLKKKNADNSLPV